MAETMQEHIYVVPLRESRRAPRWKRSHTAIKDIRKFLVRHMKSDDIKIHQSINELVWARGSQNPPSRVRIRAIKLEDGRVEAELAAKD